MQKDAFDLCRAVFRLETEKWATVRVQAYGFSNWRPFDGAALCLDYNIDTVDMI